MQLLLSRGANLDAEAGGFGSRVDFSIVQTPRENYRDPPWHGSNPQHQKVYISALKLVVEQVRLKPVQILFERRHRH